MAFQLLLGSCMEAESFEQPGGPLILRFDCGEKASNSIDGRNVLENGLSCLRGIASAPMLAGEHKADPSCLVRGNRNLNIADRRLALQTNYPIQPELASVGRLACLDALIDATKMLHRRRWRVVEVPIQLGLAENFEHGLGVLRNKRLKDECICCECAHAL